MGIQEKMRAIEEEMGRTQKNKATEYHLGLLKAKLAKLKRELVGGSKGKGKTSGFGARKSGDATVAFIGLPSVGKSTLLNALTGAKSKIAEYEFTTLSCIPGILEYNGAKIQLLDLPGIIAGAKGGKGRGKEILGVARSADLVLIILDVFRPRILPTIKEELAGIGIRLDQEPPKIFMTKKERGGVEISSTVRLTRLSKKMIVGVLNEYGIHNCSIVFRENATVEQLIDVLAGNRVYNRSLVVLNKADMVSKKYLKQLDFDFTPVSAEKGENVKKVRKEIFDRLALIRVYTKPRRESADLKEPMMLRLGATIRQACHKLHRDLVRDFKYALVWGKSAKFPGQKVGLDHVLADGDVFSVIKKQG